MPREDTSLLPPEKGAEGRQTTNSVYAAGTYASIMATTEFTEPKLSLIQVAFSVLTFFLGASIVGFPHHFAILGWVWGSITLVLVPLMLGWCYYAYYQVLEKVAGHGYPTSSGPQVAGFVYGNAADVGVFLLQQVALFLIAVAYFHAGAEQIPKLLGIPEGEWFGESKIFTTEKISLVLTVIGLSALSFMKSLDFLVKISFIVTITLVFYFVGLAVSVFGVLDLSEPRSFTPNYETEMQTNGFFSGLLMFFGAVTQFVVGFYSMPSLPSLYTKIDKKPSLLTAIFLALGGAISVYMIFIGMAYYGFGDQVESKIVDNLGEDEGWTSWTVLKFFALSLLISVSLSQPLFLFLICDALKQLMGIRGYLSVADIAVRVGVSLAALVVSLAMDFKMALGLVCSTCLVFELIFLPILLLYGVLGMPEKGMLAQLQKGFFRRPLVSRVIDLVVLTFGTLICILGTTKIVVKDMLG